MDIRSPVAGTISETMADEGDEVEVGVPLFKIKAGEGAPAAAPANDPTPAPQADAAPAEKPQAPSKAEPAKKAEPAPVAEPAVSSSGAPSRGERRVPMTRMRLRIAERLKDAQNTAASLTTFNEVDMSALMKVSQTKLVLRGDYEQRDVVAPL